MTESEISENETVAEDLPENDEVEMLVHEDESESESSDEGKSIEETGFSFQTVPMESPDETVDEKIDSLCRSVNELLERTADSEDTRAMYEDMVSFYNSFGAKTRELADKLDKEVSYTRYIETQISSKSIEKECLMLKKALVEERALMGVKFDEIKSAFDEKMRQLEAESKTVQEKQNSLVQDIVKQIKKFTDIDSKLTETLEQFRKDMTKGSENEYKIVQTRCKESLNAANSEFDSVKKSIIAFLKSCEKQNNTLISKIPEQKRKFSWKDAVIYAMSALCITGMVVQVIQMFI